MPSCAPNQALVRVHATSLNAGEVRRAASAPGGRQTGWDIAGTIEEPAADGSGPPRAARVVTLVEGTGWAEFVAVDAKQVAPLTPGVTFADAATLPVAGVTALRALERRGNLIGRRALIVPGTGGVGLFAIQLARLMGAHVTAVIRDPADGPLLRRLGADDVVVGPTAEVRSRAPFDVILESLGGESLGAAIGAVAPDGVVVTFGQTIAPTASFESAKFYATGGATIYGFYLFHEWRREPIAADLERLAALVEQKALETSIDARYRADEIETAVAALRERRVTGKVVVGFVD